MDYVKNGKMTGGFALVAWPAQYDATGIMTFVVAADGTVFEKDLGPDTATAVKSLTRYDPDPLRRAGSLAATGIWGASVSHSPVSSRLGIKCRALRFS